MRAYFKNNFNQKTVENLEPPRGSFLTEQDAQFLEDMFDDGKENFDINGQTYTRKQAFCVIKKTLIGVIMVLDNLNNFLRVKSKNVLGHDTQICPQVSSVNRVSVANLVGNGDWTNVRYLLDFGLLGLSVQELLSKVRIRDVLLYVKLARLNFYLIKPQKMKNRRICTRRIWIRKFGDSGFSNNKSRTEQTEKDSIDQLERKNDVDSFQMKKNQPELTKTTRKEPKSEFESQAEHLNSTVDETGELVQIEVNEYEIREILLGKQKREDELLKNSFRVLRKAIEKSARDNQSTKQKHFWPNITKRLILKKKKSPKYANVIKCYVEMGLLKNELQKHILHKHEKIMEKQLNVESFMSELVSKQSKSGWTVQDIVNSMDILEQCTARSIRRKHVRRRKKKSGNRHQGQRESDLGNVLRETFGRSISRRKLPKLKRVKTQIG